LAAVDGHSPLPNHRDESMKFLPVLVASLCLATAARGADYPGPIRALVANGVSIQGEMQAPRGFRGYVGMYQGDLIPVYLLPDGEHVLVGTLYDTHGVDVTEAAFRAATTPGFSPALWALLGKSRWLAEGATQPRRIIYVFTDTDCKYCHQFWLAAQPYLRKDKVQMRSIIVAVIAPTSLGRGAAVLTSPDPAATFRTNEQTFGHSRIAPLTKVDAHTRAVIEAGKALMDRFHAFGTPVIVYRDGSGRVRMAQGAPDQETMRAIFGG
jgi:thiol:disulfide interchange protein DsbG